MPPRCNQSKKEAVLQLCNFLCTQSVSEITDLANGEILYRTIQARFPSFTDVQSCEEDLSGCCTKSNTISLNSEDPANESNPATNKEDIFLQYIKNFIDDHYDIKSENFIEYEKCINFDELEILKAAVFVLSEIIKHLLETNSEDLVTLFHIDIKFQVEMKMIFTLFITEREKLNKCEIEKLFTRKSNNVSPLTTPRRTSTRHREQLKETHSPKEDIFTNSPLKNYFESPVFKKEGIWMKEKVKLYEKTLEEGDEQVTILEHKINKLETDLKNKEKEVKRLQKKLDEKEAENEALLGDIQSSKVQQERLSQEVTRREQDSELLKYRTVELSSQIENLLKIIKEEESNSVKRRRSSSQLHENSLLNSKEEEIRLLKEKVTSLETKMLSYKAELKDKIFAELTKKMPSGARNDSYEEMWHLKQLDRIEREQLLSTIIIADNKDLSAKLNIAQFENERLLKEIENLKRKLAGKHKKSRTPEIKDTSKTPETERFRKSSDESSFILNNSDYLIRNEHSIVSSEPEALQCSAKSSGAVLWKLYESENTYDINLNNDSIPDHSNLALINDLQLSNIKIKNIEPDSLLNQENNYVLGNLNFNIFLDELKKLTKNGSFQKVLQVFKKLQKEINGCNQLDLHLMLKIITECVCEAVTLNAESSIGERKDKCCSTDDKELCTVIELNIELDKLKNQLSAACQKHEIDLKACKSELQELKEEKIKLEDKYQESSQSLFNSRRSYNDLLTKCKELIEKLDDRKSKYFELKKLYEGSLDRLKKQQSENSDIRKIISNVCRKKSYYEKLHKLSQEETSKYKTELQILKEENKKILKEKETWSAAQATLRDSLPSRDSCMSQFSTKSDVQENTSESVLSGAFQKSTSHYISENEDDFCYYNSLNPIKKEYDDERVEEIKRRNSLYPRQLQSSYPLEGDLNATYHSLYVQDKCREQQQQHSKKRKLESLELQMPSHYIVKTPAKSAKKKFITPPSFRKFLERKQKPISFNSKSSP